MNKQAKLLAFILTPIFFSACYGEYENGARLLPVADAGGDIEFTCPALCKDYNQPQPLDGSASRDPLGEELLYNWSIVSLPEKTNFGVGLRNPEAAQPFFTVHSAGEYVFSLVVTAGDRMSEPDYVTVLVKENSTDDSSNK